jgi:hypothetical protein
MLVTQAGQGIYVTRVEFNQKMDRIDQKFDEMTDTMIKQFDRMYDHMDNRFDRIDSDLSLIKRHLGIKDELFKTS